MVRDSKWSLAHQPLILDFSNNTVDFGSFQCFVKCHGR